MSKVADRWLWAAGLILLAGALLHLLMPLGGPAWYAFFGAPDGLVAMVQNGALRPAISCIVIAVLLLVMAAYSFSAAGMIRRLPGLRSVLSLFGAVLLLRGLLFIPLAVLRPQLLSGICGKCDGLTPFLLVTTALCLFLGGVLAYGAWRTRL